MNIRVRIARDRRTAGHACGYVSFVLKWPSGSTSRRSFHCKSLTVIIHRFLNELQRILPAERSLATASLKAAVRKARGGQAWIQLASWTGEHSVEKFFQEARIVWRKLAKEDDDHQKVNIGDEMLDT